MHLTLREMAPLFAPAPSTSESPTPEASGPMPMPAPREGIPFNDWAVFLELKRLHPRTATAVSLEGGVPNGPLSRKTISACLRRLEKLGLVCRPHGERQGWTLSPHLAREFSEAGWP